MPVELMPLEPPRVYIPRAVYMPPEKRGRSLVIALVLLAVTIVSTLAAGAEFSLSYSQNHMPSVDDFFEVYFQAVRHPQSLLIGVPFAFTLLGILLAHELGHYFTCRYYKMSASYPYFLPFPSLFGTLGAFIRIRSPIANRKALFDVGLSGPVVGFIFTVPALALAILHSKVIPGVEAASQMTFGEPMALQLLMALLRPGVAAGDLLLHPVGRAAWVGLFVTSLNLLPASQLDGGHVLYSLAPGIHKRATLLVALSLVPLAILWPSWIIWAILLLAFGYRHPPLLDRWEPLDKKRHVWAAVGLAIFVLSFMPVPLISRGGWWHNF